MDSLTQFTLGATVSAVFLGQYIGYQKAAVIGGLMGTVPDLDTFVPVSYTHLTLPTNREV